MKNGDCRDGNMCPMRHLKEKRGRSSSPSALTAAPGNRPARSKSSSGNSNDSEGTKQRKKAEKETTLKNLEAAKKKKNQALKEFRSASKAAKKKKSKSPTAHIMIDASSSVFPDK